MYFPFLKNVEELLNIQLFFCHWKDTLDFPEELDFVAEVEFCVGSIAVLLVSELTSVVSLETEFDELNVKALAELKIPNAIINEIIFLNLFIDDHLLIKLNLYTQPAW